MNYYSPLGNNSEPNPSENNERLRRGLIALIAGEAIEFSKRNSDLIVVFDGPFNRYSNGRILLFQQYLYDKTGLFAQVVKEIPACIKVFFALDITSEDHARWTLQVLKSSESKELYRSLNISRLQFRGELIPPLRP